MGYEPYDAEQEAAEMLLERAYEHVRTESAADRADELYREHYREAVAEFKSDRLQSYYRKHPDMAKTAITMIEEARSLSNANPRAALLFAVSAAEITIKHLLLKPIVNGLVHDEAVADVVMKLTPPQTGSEAFKELLFGVLNKVAQLDLRSYKRANSAQTLWDEWKEVQKVRNDLIHDGAAPTNRSLTLSEPVASEFLNVVFPKVLDALGLTVNGYMLIT